MLGSLGQSTGFVSRWARGSPGFTLPKWWDPSVAQALQVSARDPVSWLWSRGSEMAGATAGGPRLLLEEGARCPLPSGAFSVVICLSLIRFFEKGDIAPHNADLKKKNPLIPD